MAMRDVNIRRRSIKDIGNSSVLFFCNSSVSLKLFHNKNFFFKNKSQVQSSEEIVTDPLLTLTDLLPAF